jgi:hypothetical protein
VESSVARFMLGERAYDLGRDLPVEHLGLRVAFSKPLLEQTYVFASTPSGQRVACCSTSVVCRR